jgi:hypothetical protein
VKDAEETVFATDVSGALHNGLLNIQETKAIKNEV